MCSIQNGQNDLSRYAIHKGAENVGELTRSQKIERSIIKRFRKPIWNAFIKSVKTYELVKPGDKIAVCISGGKDSMLMAKCMQHLHTYSEIPFDIAFLCMNPGYTEENWNLIQQNAQTLALPLHTFETRIFEVVEKQIHHPCYLCARMRRGHLYNSAQKLGCNKIALGHHFDDVIETILMGMLYGSQTQTMMPKLHSANFPGMELIRPLYLMREADIIHWAQYNDLHFLQCACKMTKEHPERETLSKRKEIKALIAKLKVSNPGVEKNIFNSVCNVNLRTIISYHEGNVYHHFLDNYDARTEKLRKVSENKF